jgi:hypothetical protein
LEEPSALLGLVDRRKIAFAVSLVQAWEAARNVQVPGEHSGLEYLSARAEALCPEHVVEAFGPVVQDFDVAALPETLSDLE